MAENEKKFGCQHYKRKCAFVSPCCNRTYTCRVCHDEAETHEINRHKVKEIQCLQCQKVQKVSNKCIKCEVTFGQYFCEVCRLFDDTEKGQFHCNKCGICRIGGRDKFFHCDKCDSCLSTSLKGSHKCVEKGTRSNCPICLEDLHTSREPIQVPRCGHFIHQKCLEEMIKNGNFACGLCGESLQNMSAVWEILDREVSDTQMPPEYSDFHVQILCKDCHKESRVVFHIVGLKCQECGSYNTCRAADPGSSEEEPDNRTVENQRQTAGTETSEVQTGPTNHNTSTTIENRTERESNSSTNVQQNSVASGTDEAEELLRV